MRHLKNIAKYCLLLIGIVLFRSRKSKILYYHDIHGGERYTDMSTSLDLFKKHIEQIKKCGYKVVPNITNPEEQVRIMLDDGFRGIYECRQFFYENEIKPTIFLAVSLIGQSGYLTIDEILELQDHGFNFQSHGWRHKNMAAMSDDELDLELVGARKELQTILGKQVNQICFPIGYFSDHLLALLKREKYSEIYSSIPGSYNDLIYGMRRRNLVQHSSALEVRMIINGGGEILTSRYIKLHKVI